MIEEPITQTAKALLSRFFGQLSDPLEGKMRKG